MKTLFNLIGALLTLVMVAAFALGIFMFGMRTQQTADEEAKDLSNYEIVIGSDGINAEFALDEKDIIEKTVFDIMEEIDDTIQGVADTL